MKKIKFLFIGIVFCAISAVGYNVYTNATMTEEERLILANIEALSNDGEGYQGSCEFSYVFRCVVVCNSCGAVHYPDGLYNLDYMKPVNVTGSCDICGTSY